MQNLKTKLKNSKHRFNIFLSFVLLIGVTFSIVSITKATTPNPGHGWSQTGDGVFAITGPTSLHTYTFPDTDATVVTTANNLSSLSSTTSLQLLNLISDETGTGNAVFSISPVFTTPNIGNATGSISGNAGTATSLQNTRTIAGVLFDGTSNISIASTNLSDTSNIARLDAANAFTNVGNNTFVGNVGIGLTNPSSKLNVTGDIRITAGSGGALIFADGTSINTSSIPGSAGSMSNISDAITTGDSDANGTGDVILKTGSNDRLHILNNGNVGIGTAVPGAKFHISGANAPYRGQLSLEDSNLTQITFYSGPVTQTDLRTQIYRDTSTVGGSFTIDNRGGAILFNPAGSSGNIGIGITNPNRTLHLSSTGSTGVTLQGTGTGGISYGLISTSGGSSQGDGKFIVYQDGYGSRFVIDNGNVGIGTTIPISLLDLSSNSAAQLMTTLYSAGAGSGRIALRSARGTQALPTATQVGDRIGFIGFGGYGDNSFGEVAAIVGSAAETFTNTSKGSLLSFETAALGSTSRTERMRIDNAGNVGIGTTSSSTKLQIGDASTVGTIYLNSTAGNVSSLSLARSDTSWRIANETNFRIYGNGSADGYSNSPSTYIPFQIEVQTPSNTLYLKNTGNVGIGTTGPSGLGKVLNIYNGTNTGSSLVLEGNSGSNFLTLYSSATAGDPASIFSKDGIKFATATAKDATGWSEAMRISSGGNIGIGTTNPGAVLDVAGNMKSTGTFFHFGNSYYDASASLIFQVRSSFNAPVFPNEMSGISSYPIINTVNTGRVTSITAGVNTNIAGTLGTWTGLNIRPKDGVTTITNTTYALLGTGIAPSGNYGIYDASGFQSYFAGNVGIGTTNPAAALQITRGAGVKSDILFSNTANNWSIETGTATNFLRIIDNQWGERIRIDSTGNVGIGTTTPGEKLQVFGNIKTSGGGNSVIIGNPSGDYWSTIKNDASSGAGNFVFRPGGVDTVWMLSNGNVGIGTTTPGTLLDVAGTATVKGLVITGAGATSVASYNPTATFAAYTNYGGSNPNLLQIGSENSTGGYISTGSAAYSGVISTSAAYPLHFGTNGVVKMTILSGGNVGIGTTSPGQLLEVNGNAQFDGLAYFTRNAQNISLSPTTNTATTFINMSNLSGRGVLGVEGNTSGPMMGGDTPYATVLGTISATPLQFGTNNAVNMTILSAGNVGIGTTAPGAKFDVEAGNASGFKLNGYSGVADNAGELELEGWHGVNVVLDRTNGYSDRVFTISHNASFIGGGSPTELFRVQENGNVGIGTTNPIALLNLQQSNSGGKVNLFIQNSAGSALNNTAAIRLAVNNGATITNGGAEIAAINVNAGNAATDLAFTTFGTGGNVEKMRITSDGNVGIGTTTPGSKLGVSYAYPSVGASWVSDNTATHTAFSFNNPNGQVGTINTGGSTTAYNTTSDQRLKTDEGVATDISVLQNLVIHNFKWNSDGTPDRGVFAQEAYLVKPSAVAVGTDQIDTNGNLIHPWGVDYSKFVSDLIVGWQSHEKTLIDLNLNLESINQPIPSINSFGDKFFSNLFSRLIAWFGDSANGIGEFFASKVHTKEICVAKANGTEFCADGDKLEAMVGSAQSNNGESSESTIPDTTPPIIILIGDGIINLNVEDKYEEFGATATDNIDISISVVITGTVNTSVVGAYTIHYNASDVAGNKAIEIIRTININEVAL